MSSASAAEAMSSARLTWLHLSDLHLRVSTGWSQDVVLSTMLADIRSRYGAGNCPDLVFLTGDIAFSGKEEEYTFAEDFVRKLCSAINLPTERLCIVPGNHDIDLSREEDAVAGARHVLSNAIEVDRFFGNEGRRKTLFARQAAFRAFVNRVLSPAAPTYSPSSYAHVRTLQVGAIRVRVLLLDSAWLAGGGPSDAGEILVGERQALDCANPDEGCLTFTLLHHPFAWLREFEQIPIENLVARSAQICLRGHVHTTDLRATDGPQGRLITFTAGAAFQTRTADNTYIWCSLDLTTGLGEKIVHRYRHAEHRWEAGARESWAFSPKAPPPSDFAFIRKALLAARARYVSYVSCLIGNLQTEVPLFLPMGRLAFVALDARLPESANSFGDLIVRLRNHFHWKQVWDVTAWERSSQHDCAGCALKQSCCPNTPARKIARSVHEDARDVGRAIAKTPEYAQSKRQRKKVEMLFAHLKRILKLDRLRLRGLSGARDEFLLAATAQNLRRMAKRLLEAKPESLVTA